jgi:hypothetical protein
MIDGIQIQKERDQLVSDNTDKFKTKTWKIIIYNDR